MFFKSMNNNTRTLICLLLDIVTKYSIYIDTQILNFKDLIILVCVHVYLNLVSTVIN